MNFPMKMEQWVCANPVCRFILVLGVTASGVPDKCPKCGGKAWDVHGDADHCRVTKGKHDWKMGVDAQGVPHIDSNQYCRACGAIPIVEGTVQ